MKCVVCRHGETLPGRATVTLIRDSLTLVVKGVPAQVCDNCGEEYVDGEVAREILDVAEETLKAGAEVEIREYKAA